jgi:hypothetical protein
MAEYLILIYGDEKRFADINQAEFDEMMKGHAAFAEKHGPALRGGNALWGTDTATSISEDGTVTDGAFAETKEALGGYYLVEAASLDEAIAIAKDVPAAFGGVEVRPIRVFD